MASGGRFVVGSGGIFSSLFNGFFGSTPIYETKDQPGKVSNMPKLAKSIPVNAQEGYIPVHDKSPSRQNVKHAQAGKIYSGKHPKRLCTGIWKRCR